MLVTGCDSGFGNLAARRLDDYGFKVFAGCLFPDAPAADSLKNSSKSRKLQVVKLDVTKRHEVEAVVELIKESGINLHAVINNAGIAEYVPAEWGDDVAEYERMFSVNTFGLVRVTKACLPLLRKARGRVVNLSSMMGRISFVGINAYCMSKAAVRAFSDGLRREMYPHRVKVVVIEPMMYATNIMNTENFFAQLDRVWKTTSAEVKDDYGGEEFKETFKRRFAERIVINMKLTF